MTVRPKPFVRVFLWTFIAALIWTPKAWPDAARYLNVGVNLSNPPWAFLIDGRPTGFEIDLVDAVADRLGRKVNYIAAPFSDLFDGLLDGRWRLAAGSIWIKPARLNILAFADPYFASRAAIAVRRDSPVHTLSDLKGKKIGAAAGSRHEGWLGKNEPAYGPYAVAKFDNASEAIMALEFRKIDAVAADSAETLLAMRDLPFLENRILFGPAHAQAIAFRKGDPLRNKVNGIQNGLKTDGTLAAIYEKWFKRTPPDGDMVATVLDEPYLPED